MMQKNRRSLRNGWRSLAASISLTALVPSGASAQWCGPWGCGKTAAPAYPVGQPYPVAGPAYAPQPSPPFYPGSTVPPTAPANATAMAGPPPVSATTSIPWTGLPQTQMSLMPTAGYASQWNRAEVTYYRPVTTVNPATGQPITQLIPCTSYELQNQRVPVVTMKPGAAPATYPSTDRWPSLTAPTYGAATPVPTQNYQTVPANGATAVTGQQVNYGTYTPYQVNNAISPQAPSAGSMFSFPSPLPSASGVPAGWSGSSTTAAMPVTPSSVPATSGAIYYGAPTPAALPSWPQAAIAPAVQPMMTQLPNGEVASAPGFQSSVYAAPMIPAPVVSAVGGTLPYAPGTIAAGVSPAAPSSGTIVAPAGAWTPANGTVIDSNWNPIPTVGPAVAPEPPRSRDEQPVPGSSSPLLPSQPGPLVIPSIVSPQSATADPLLPSQPTGPKSVEDRESVVIPTLPSDTQDSSEGMFRLRPLEPTEGAGAAGAEPSDRSREGASGAAEEPANANSAKEAGDGKAQESTGANAPTATSANGLQQSRSNPWRSIDPIPASSNRTAPQWNPQLMQPRRAPPATTGAQPMAQAPSVPDASLVSSRSR
jgi:hypothetical protein